MVMEKVLYLISHEYDLHNSFNKTNTDVLSSTIKLLFNFVNERNLKRKMLFILILFKENQIVWNTFIVNLFIARAKVHVKPSLKEQRRTYYQTTFKCSLILANRARTWYIMYRSTFIWKIKALDVGEQLTPSFLLMGNRWLWNFKY